jgi:hypothetical protein
MRRALLLLLCLALPAALLALPATAREPSIEKLLGELLRATSDPAVDEVLDALADRIGKKPGFADHGAFGDWLGQVAGKKATHHLLLLRRGWAYLGARRASDAIRALEEAGKHPEARASALAYLGEAWRQNGKPAKALGLLAEAESAGYPDGVFLDEAAHKAGFEIRQLQPSKSADRLPPYAAPMDRYLAVRPSAELHAAVARWIVDDHFAYAKDGAERARLWSAYGAEQVLKAMRLSRALGGSAQLCLDAAWALRRDHADPAGRPLYFDCLAWAYRLGKGPDSDTHEVPQAIALLAESALEEARYPLAAKLARERLDISDSVLARDVLKRLPVDLGQ